MWDPNHAQSCGHHSVLRLDPNSGELNVAFDGGWWQATGNTTLYLSHSSTGGYGIGAAMNEAGQIVAGAGFRNVSLSSHLLRLTPVVDPNNAVTDDVTVIASLGDNVLDVNGLSIGTLWGSPLRWAIADSGDVVFDGSIYDGNSVYTRAILAGVGDSVVAVAREGQPVPGGLGLFAGNMRRFALSDSGDIAIQGYVDVPDSGVNIEALFTLGVNEGANIVLHQNEPIFGALLSSFDFSTGTNERGTERSGFNDSGQIAFSFRLQNALDGIALYTPDVSSLAADIDWDRDADQDDFIAMTACLGGPEIVTAPQGCDLPVFRASDFDADLDADITDFAGFQRAYQP